MKSFPQVKQDSFTEEEEAAAFASTPSSVLSTPVDPYDIPKANLPFAAPHKLKPYNGFALLSFWTSLFGFNLLSSLVGHIALYQLRYVGFEKGKTLAWAGILIGYFTWMCLILMVLNFLHFTYTGMFFTVENFPYYWNLGINSI